MSNSHTELERLRSEPGDAFEKLSNAIDKAKFDVIKWIAGLMVAQGVAIVALIKFLPGNHP